MNLANGPSSGAALSGGATILSQSTTQVAAQSVGAIGGLLGVGVYTADATSSPTVATTLDQFPMTAGGALQVGAQVAGLNTARAIAGSGGLFSGEASKAVLQTSPTVSTTITASALTGASLSVQALDQSRYNAYSDSVNAAVLGMSGAIVVNTAAPAASLQLAGGTALQATTGGVTLGAQTALINLGGEASLVDAGGQGDLAMVRLGAGGGLVGYAGGVYSNYTPSATLVVGDGVTVTAPQGIGVVASQDFQSSEVAVLKTGGLIDVSVAIAQLTANFDTTLTIGESTTWQSSLGDVEMGTVVNVSADNLGLSKTWGLAGGADGQGASTIAVAQGVTVGAGTTITALDDVVILAGENPTTRQVTQIDALSMGDAHFGGLAGD
ncbi:MAG: hypothetical protein ACKO3P_01865, partial [Planctomycetaceae bacterium]